MSKFVDFYIIYSIDHFDKVPGSRCLSPLYYIEYLVKDNTFLKEDILSKTNIIIDFRGVEWSDNEGMKAVNSTYFYSKYQSLNRIKNESSCDEYLYYYYDNCVINYPLIEFISKRLELARKYNLGIILLHLDHAHPNIYNLL